MSLAEPVKIRYNDLAFRIILALVAAHLIVSFGAKETFFQLLLMWDFYRSLLISFVIAFILINLVYLATVQLDKRFDWKAYTLQRVALQILFACIAPAIFAFLMATLYFAAFGMWIFNTRYLQFDFPVVCLMILFLNIYYLAFYFYRRWEFSEQRLAEGKIEPITKERGKEVIIVNKGTKNQPIPIETVSYFFHDGDYNFLRTIDREDFIIPFTLDEMQSQLNDKQFFRVNRQMIVNYNACQHFELLQYGRLELTLNPAPKESVIISQKRAKDFKDWISR